MNEYNEDNGDNGDNKDNEDNDDNYENDVDEDYEENYNKTSIDSAQFIFSNLTPFNLSFAQLNVV